MDDETQDGYCGADPDAARKVMARRCAYCNAGLDRHAWTGGTFIHVLTRDAEGRIAKSRPCTRS